MPRYAEVQAGTVVNVIVSDPTVAAQRGWIVATREAGVGWSWDGVQFTPPPAPPPEPPTAIEIAKGLVRQRPDSSPVTVKDLKDIGLV